MPFNEDLTPPFDNVTEVTFGERAEVIIPGAGDQVDVNGRYYKYFVAAAAGDVSYLGYRNADTDTALTMSVQAGQTLPGRIRRITASTVELHGWSD